ncbi:MAG: 4Fe-4S ferredoxin [Okeania sp. SIO2H7]|nr:4Fe-4S ferredoxin [Okeania sp. SIO2H7]
MSYTITSQCIGCDRCLSSCPTQAIQQDGDRYWIDANQCDGCQKTHGTPQCWAACPTNNGCVFLVDGPIAFAKTAGSVQEYWDSWFTTYNALVTRLKQTQTSEYWRSWFDSYAAKVSQMQPNAT